MTPPTVNAYYNPSLNEVVFAAGILQPPFYDAKADDAVNYGAIGAGIGHEMTHGFDDEGRQFDEKGNLADWWSAESEKRFKERAGRIVKQFSRLRRPRRPPRERRAHPGREHRGPGGHQDLLHGAGDGSRGRPPAERIDGFTPEQRFFLSFASVWRDNQRPEATRLQVNTDPHSPAALPGQRAALQPPRVCRRLRRPCGRPDAPAGRRPRDHLVMLAADRNPIAGRRVQLMATCLCDAFHDDVAAATVEVLEHLGCEVVFPEGQTCCGQPAFNGGDWAASRRVVRHALAHVRRQPTPLSFRRAPARRCSSTARRSSSSTSPTCGEVDGARPAHLGARRTSS